MNAGGLPMDCVLEEKNIRRGKVACQSVHAKVELPFKSPKEKIYSVRNAGALKICRDITKSPMRTIRNCGKIQTISPYSVQNVTPPSIPG
jgi:hypothetical protein